MFNENIYTVAMHKGGVGKTTITTNLAGALALKNKRILVIDTDGQGNASIAFGLNPNELKKTIHGVMLKTHKAEDVIINVSKNIDLIPANIEMNFIEMDVWSQIDQYKKPFHLLHDNIKDVVRHYDFVLIDTPPSMGLVTGNVLACARHVIIPFVPEVFAVQGLIRMIDAIEDFRQQLNPQLTISGVVGMMVDQRTTLHSEMLQQTRKWGAENNVKVYDTIIPRSIRFAHATAYESKPAVWTDRKNPIVEAYFKLTKEVFNL